MVDTYNNPNATAPGTTPSIANMSIYTTNTLSTVTDLGTQVGLGAGIGAGIVLLLSILLATFLIRRYKKQSSSSVNYPLETSPIEAVDGNYEMIGGNTIGGNTKDWEIEYDQIEIKQELGR